MFGHDTNGSDVEDLGLSSGGGPSLVAAASPLRYTTVHYSTLHSSTVYTMKVNRIQLLIEYSSSPRICRNFTCDFVFLDTLADQSWLYFCFCSGPSAEKRFWLLAFDL